MATTDGKGRPIWVVAAEREDAGRFIVHADQELPAFLELESLNFALVLVRFDHVARYFQMGGQFLKRWESKKV